MSHPAQGRESIPFLIIHSYQHFRRLIIPREFDEQFLHYSIEQKPLLHSFLPQGLKINVDFFETYLYIVGIVLHGIWLVVLGLLSRILQGCRTSTGTFDTVVESIARFARCSIVLERHKRERCSDYWFYLFGRSIGGQGGHCSRLLSLR